MKTIHGVIILSAFVVIAVFGFWAMGGGGHSAPIHSCIAAVAGSAPCPNDDPLGYASFHLNFFKNFSSAVDGGLAAFALAISLLIFSFFAIFIFLIPDALSANPVDRVVERFSSGNFLIRLRRRLSFYENSPSSLRGNMV